MLTDKHLDWLVTHNARLEIFAEPTEGQDTTVLLVRLDAADGCGLERKGTEERVLLAKLKDRAERQNVFSCLIDSMIERLSGVC